MTFNIKKLIFHFFVYLGAINNNMCLSLTKLECLMDEYLNNKILDLEVLIPVSEDDKNDITDNLDDNIIECYNSEIVRGTSLYGLCLGGDLVFLLQRRIINVFKDEFNDIPELMKLTDPTSLIELYLYIYGLQHHDRLLELYQTTHQK